MDVAGSMAKAVVVYGPGLDEQISDEDEGDAVVSIDDDDQE
jgi:hypothetical protein